MNFHFDKEQLQDFKSNIKKEWAITNGLGGYAGGSINVRKPYTSGIFDCQSSPTG